MSKTFFVFLLNERVQFFPGYIGLITKRGAVLEDFALRLIFFKWLTKEFASNVFLSISGMPVVFFSTSFYIQSLI